MKVGARVKWDMGGHHQGSGEVIGDQNGHLLVAKDGAEKQVLYFSSLHVKPIDWKPEDDEKLAKKDKADLNAAAGKPSHPEDSASSVGKKETLEKKLEAHHEKEHTGPKVTDLKKK